MIVIRLYFAAALVLGQSGDWTPYDQADARLNGAYDLLRAHMRPSDQIDLRNAQRAWIADRNATCGREARNKCATDKTTRRAVALERGIERIKTYVDLDDKSLLRLEGIADDICRGSGQDSDGVVCERRDTLVSQLESRGWCWGPDKAEAEFERHWMRAGKACRLDIRQ